MNGYIYKFGAASLLVMVMLPVSHSIVAVFSYNEFDVPKSQWAPSLIRTVALTFLVGVALAPFTSLAVFVYTETRRLR